MPFFSVFAYPIFFLFPGLGLASIFLKKSQRHPVIWALFSLVVTPPVLAAAATIFPLRESLNLVLFLLLLTLGGLALGGKIDEEKKLEFPLPSFSRRQLGLLLLLTFFIAFPAVFPRRGLFDQSFLLGSGDEPKHLEVITSIATLGFPPQNWARPSEKLVYYYYDYVYPGVLAKILPQVSPMQAWAAHTFWQTALQSVLLFGIAFFFLKQVNLALAALFIINFVGGFDYFVSQNRTIGIEYWMDTVPMSVRNLQISLPSTLLGFVPQHFFAAVVSFVFPAVLFFARGASGLKWLLAGVVLGALVGLSTFVFLGWLVGFAAYSLIRLGKVRDFLITFAPALAVGLLVFLPLLPTLWEGPNLFRLREATFFPLAPWPVPLLLILSLPLFLILELNLVPLLAYAAPFLPFKKDDTFTYLTCQSLVFPLTIFFLSTAGNNDYGLRGIIPAQIGMVFLSLMVISYFARKVKGSLLIACLAVLGVAFLAGVVSSLQGWLFLEKQKISIPERFRQIANFVPPDSVIFYDGEVSGLDEKTITGFSLPTFSSRLIYVAGGQFVLRGGYETQYLRNDIFLEKIIPEGDWLSYRSLADFCPFLETPLGSLSTFAVATKERNKWPETLPNKQVDGYVFILIPIEKIRSECGAAALRVSWFRATSSPKIEF